MVRRFFGALISLIFFSHPGVSAVLAGRPIGPGRDAYGGPPGFASDGSACARDAGEVGIFDAEGKRVQTVDFSAAAAKAIDRDLFVRGGRWDRKADLGPMVDDRVVFDTVGRAYTLVIPRYSNLRSAALLVSMDHCRTWQAVPLTGRNATVERPDTRNDTSGPPTVLSYETYGSLVGGKLWLERFKISGRRLVREGASQMIADNSLLGSNHSGGGNASFTTRSRIFIAYPTMDRSAAGTQEAVREFDRESDKFIAPSQIIGRSLSATSDPHDLDAISQFPDGRLVVIIGAHHAMFQMLVSRRPNTFASGFDQAVEIGEPRHGRSYGSFTYASLNISQSGTINIIARAEGDQGKYQLVQMRRLATGGWEVWPNGLHYRVLVDPDRADYMAWRQQVSLGVGGRLYLTYRRYANEFTGVEAKSLGLDLSRGTPGNCTGRCWYNDSPTGPAQTLVSVDDGKSWHPAGN